MGNQGYPNYFDRNEAKRTIKATAPMVCGGVYRWRDDQRGVIYLATMVYVEEMPNGGLQGTLNNGQRGMMTYRERTEEWARWELVATPVPLDTPKGAIIDDEAAKLRQEREESETKLKRMDLILKVGKFVIAGLSAADIAKRTSTPKAEVQAILDEYFPAPEKA